MNIGIIVQARYQSTRLPGKVLLDFYEGKTILEILIDNLIKKTNLQVVLATSIENADDKIIELCERKGYKYFRGSENDVLSRFIGAAEDNGFSHVIRICSDNPFIIPEAVSILSEELRKNPDKSYISYKIGQSPSILTHYGLWGELASIEALKIAAQSSERLYHEHVTNYLYSNPDIFDLLWLKTNDKLSETKNLRLTVDDAVDFKNTQILMNETGTDFSLDTIISNVKKNSELLLSMESQIAKHQK
jgi:spore coat polysaccharide biosynthesis protein SpsF